MLHLWSGVHKNLQKKVLSAFKKHQKNPKDKKLLADYSERLKEYYAFLRLTTIAADLTIEVRDLREFLTVLENSGKLHQGSSTEKKNLN